MSSLSTAKDRIVISILAAKSQQSSAIVSHLLSLGNDFSNRFRIRAIVRDPQTYNFPKERSDGLHQNNDEIVAGDMNNLESLKKALKGSNVVWAMTSAVDGEGPEGEFKLGKNIVDAFLQVTKEGRNTQSNPLLFFSSAVDAPSRTDGKIVMANALGKAMVEKYIHGLPIQVQDSIYHTFVHCGMFLQNFITYQKPSIDDQGIYHFRAAVRPDVQIPFLDVKDLGPLIWHLIQQAFPTIPSSTSYQDYDRAVIRAFGDSLSYPQLVSIFATATGCKAMYDYVSLEQFLADSFGTTVEQVRKQMLDREEAKGAETIVTMIGDMYNLINQHGYYGGLNETNDKDPLTRKIIFQQPTTRSPWSSFAKAHFALDTDESTTDTSIDLQFTATISDHLSPAEAFLKDWATYFIKGSSKSSSKQFHERENLTSSDYQVEILDKWFACDATVIFPYFPKTMRDAMSLKSLDGKSEEDGAKLEGHAEILNYFNEWRKTFWFRKGEISSLHSLSLQTSESFQGAAVMEMRLEGRVYTSSEKAYVQDYVSFAYVNQDGKVVLYKEYWAADRF